MFDAKSLLEAVMQGAHPNPQQQQQGMGGLGDILGQLAGAMQGGGGASPGGAGGSLGDILGKMMQGAGASGSAPASAGVPATGGPAGGAPAGGGGLGGLGGLGDILGKLGGATGPGAAGGQSTANQGGGTLGDILGQLQKQVSQAGAGGGSLMDILGAVLGQATAGAREGAGQLDQATGASQRAKEILAQATGKSPEEAMRQLQDLIKTNQLGATAAAAGLGGLVLGTRTGRSAAIGAAKLGALALIGGLAFKAYQNYAQGKPLIALPAGGAAAGTGAGSALVAEPAPAGSGFEPQAISNDSATLYLRAMIGAAAADGRIDEAEQKKILGGLAQAGLDDAAHTFLKQELANPAGPDDLAGAVKTPAEALQVYTAARLAIDPNEDDENQQYLAALAQALGIDDKLAAHVEQMAAQAA